ncbi:MAG: hypothetical protein LM567_04680 [Desulfurococcaceae archaeon]|jgi:hypothetical protein|nr:hypothetical protein [Desulfurococcaceae archaeon]
MLSRYTILVVNPQKGVNREAISLFEDIYRRISSEMIKYGCLTYIIAPWTILLLSNGVKDDVHRELFESLKSKNYFNVKLVSITSSSPIHAILTATRILSKKDYYFQEGVEEPYTISVFTSKWAIEKVDLLSNIALQIRTFLEISQLILNSGGLPLSISLGKLVSVIKKDSLTILKELIKHVKIGFGVDYLAINALNRAEENLFSQETVNY